MLEPDNIGVGVRRLIALDDVVRKFGDFDEE